MSPEDQAEKSRLIREIDAMRARVNEIDMRELLSKTNIRIGDTIEFDHGKGRRQAKVFRIGSFCNEPCFFILTSTGISRQICDYNHPKKVS